MQKAKPTLLLEHPPGTLRFLLLLIQTMPQLVVHGEVVMVAGAPETKLTTLLKWKSKLVAMLSEIPDVSKVLCLNLSNRCLVVFHFKIRR